MPISPMLRRAVRSLPVMALVAATGFTVDRAVAFKDVGPSSAACDAQIKDSPAWIACVGAASASANRSDAELFYAGYWLARSGHYDDALSYLRQAKAPDEKVLTYIGFATRKLGRVDEALGYYERALAMNPGYSVARAYMGEGFLAKGQPDKAREQLAEIATRSGTTSAEYADLAGHIARWEKGVQDNG